MLARAAVVALVFMMAGCATPEEAMPSSTEPTVAAPARFTDSTGAIDGIVVDEEEVPLAQAQVTIVETLETTTTDSTGRFTFSELPAKRYTLAAARTGFEPALRVVDVQAGVAATVRVTLTAIVVPEPHHETFSERGTASCFASYRLQPATGTGNVYCGHAHEAAGLNKHRIWWQPFGNAGNWTASVFEQTWESTQLAGGGMQGKLYLPNCGDVVFFEGASPLRGRANASHVAQWLDGAVESCAADCALDACALQTWVGGLPFLLGPGSAADAGLLFDQSFEQFHTAFFWMDAPESFTALEDA